MYVRIPVDCKKLTLIDTIAGIERLNSSAVFFIDKWVLHREIVDTCNSMLFAANDTLVRPKYVYLRPARINISRVWETEVVIDCTLKCRLFNAISMTETV